LILENLLVQKHLATSLL